MKKLIVIFSMLAASGSAFASVVNWIYVENKTGQTLYPWPIKARDCHLVNKNNPEAIPHGKTVKLVYKNGENECQYRLSFFKSLAQKHTFGSVKYSWNATMPDPICSNLFYTYPTNCFVSQSKNVHLSYRGNQGDTSKWKIIVYR